MDYKKNLMHMSALGVGGAVSLSDLHQPLVQEDTPVAIIGTGDYARALAKRLANAGKQVLCGSRFPDKRHLAGRDRELGGLDVTVCHIARALQEADVVFLAMHSDHIEQTLKPYQHLLSGKILVDISNPDHSTKYFSHAERIAKRYPNAHVVKAFNTISAYALQNGLDEGDRKVHIAADSKQAAEIVADLAQAMGLETVRYSSLQEAGRLESQQRSLFRGWGTALIITTVIFLAWGIYGTYRYHVKKGHAWSRWPVNTMNKVYGCTALTVLPLCYLAGVVASALQLLRGSKQQAFPGWLDRWLRSRKQLGLLALWLAAVHAVMSIAHMSPAYFTKWFDFNAVVIPTNTTEDVKIPIDVRMNWKGETAIALGTLALGTMSILGITSLPSVSSRLNWRQWRFVQSYIGYVCLAIATAHVTMKGAPYWTSKPFADTVIGMSFLSLVVPYITMFLRLVLLLPCFSIALYKIRRGWECCGSLRGRGDGSAECGGQVCYSCAAGGPMGKSGIHSITTAQPIPNGIQNLGFEPSPSNGDDNNRKRTHSGANGDESDSSKKNGSDSSNGDSGRSSSGEARSSSEGTGGRFEPAGGVGNTPAGLITSAAAVDGEAGGEQYQLNYEMVHVA